MRRILNKFNGTSLVYKITLKKDRMCETCKKEVRGITDTLHVITCKWLDMDTDEKFKCTKEIHATERLYYSDVFTFYV